MNNVETIKIIWPLSWDGGNLALCDSHKPLGVRGRVLQFESHIVTMF